MGIPASSTIVVIDSIPGESSPRSLSEGATSPHQVPCGTSMFSTASIVLRSTTTATPRSQPRCSDEVRRHGRLGAAHPPQRRR